MVYRFLNELDHSVFDSPTYFLDDGTEDAKEVKRLLDKNNNMYDVCFVELYAEALQECIKCGMPAIMRPVLVLDRKIALDSESAVRLLEGQKAGELIFDGVDYEKVYNEEVPDPAAAENAFFDLYAEDHSDEYDPNDD